jgi:acyl-CoA thioesterase
MEDITNLQMECATPTDALEVETLDRNLFRSHEKQLWVPLRARGVFGGQVISQALVSATRTVDPAFALHVRRLCRIYRNDRLMQRHR